MPADPNYWTEQEHAHRLQDVLNAYRAQEQQLAQARALLAATLAAGDVGCVHADVLPRIRAFLADSPTP